MKGGWCSRYHIDMKIKEEDGFEWRFMGIYGESKTDEKHKMWKLLCTLTNHSDKPWLMVGDFNEILLKKIPSTHHFCPMYVKNPHRSQQTDGENHCNICNILRQQLSSINTILITKCPESSQYVARAYAAKPTQACSLSNHPMQHKNHKMANLI